MPDLRIQALFQTNRLPSATAEQVTQLLALQGSASYLMIELDLAGKLVSRQQVLDAAEQKLRHMAETCTDAAGVLGTKKGVTLAANCIYASYVLRCPAVSPPVSSQRIYSQRNFIKPGDDTKLYSQVWTGFLAEVPEKAWKHGKGALAIDMGTGELKFGYALRTKVIAANDPDLVKLRAHHEP